MPRTFILGTVALLLSACAGVIGPPAPTPTPAYIRWQTEQVVEAFQAAGLEVDSPRPMTADDYGLAPMAYEGTRFLIPSVCGECGGRIMSYDSPAKLEAGRQYYNELKNASAAFFSWVYVKGNILVQINGELPHDQAQRYSDVLDALK